MYLDWFELLQGELRRLDDTALVGLMHDMLTQKGHILTGMSHERLVELILEEFELQDIDHELDQRFTGRRKRC